ncbi:LamG-like jellyroll fold domain-containing protein [Streptomyces sp. NPDC005573]|uniref:LamG-like jellyroll fold domain-containing protein n=1 Tax=Streptomyces sp. NPDC005573 TaxID=3156890 RepID=UPI0033BC762C
MAALQQDEGSGGGQGPVIRRAVAAPMVEFNPGEAFSPLPPTESSAGAPPTGSSAGEPAAERAVEPASAIASRPQASRAEQLEPSELPSAGPVPHEPAAGGQEPPEQEPRAHEPRTARSRGALVVAAAAAGTALIAAPFLITRGDSSSHSGNSADVARMPVTTSHIPGQQPLKPLEHSSASPSPKPSAAKKPSAVKKPPAVHEPPAVKKDTAPRTAPVTKATHPAEPHDTLPAPVGSWPLDAAWSAGDSTGAQSGRASNVSFDASQGGAFDGTNSSVTTSGPVIATGPGAGFTVSAWVYLTSTRTFATAVSQDGSVNSGFYLQYSSPERRWAFARVTGDTIGAPGHRALSTAAPTLNRWTHLVGVYDGGSGELRLYVDGRPQGTSKDTTPFAASGNFVIGRGQFSSRPSDWFPGRIKNVKAFGQALSQAQVAKL